MAIALAMCLFRVSVILVGIPTVVSMSFAGTPGNVTGVVGDTVILTCAVKDKDEDNPVYWQRYDGTSNRLGTISRERDTSSYAHYNPDLSPRLEIVGDESRGEYHLLISDLNLQDQGRYVCFFINDRGFNDYSPITTLRVLPRDLMAGPDIGTEVGANPTCQATVSMPSQAVSVGTTVELVCNADGRPDITSLTWYVGNYQALNREGSCVLSKKLQQRICTFRRTLTLQDIGETFRCIAGVDPLDQQGGRRDFTPSCSITPLRITTTVDVTPKLNRVMAGETATFYCSTPANQNRLRYNWFLNDGTLQSTTQRLMVSSDYLRNNIVTCVVSDHFGYLGHGNAILDVEPPRGRPTIPVQYSTSSTLKTTLETTGKESISELIPYINHDADSVTQFSIDNSKPITNSGNQQLSLFPIVMVISLASGAILLAIFLAVITACVIKRKKRGDGHFKDSVVQLEIARPEAGQYPNNGYSQVIKSRENSKKVPTVTKWEPDSAQGNNNETPNAYAVLDPDRVDNDSLSSLELQDIINSSGGSPSDQPATRLKTRPRDVEKEHKDIFSTRGKPQMSRGRSASTPGGPVIFYAGERNQDGFAVAYAVTNIIENRKWAPIVEYNDGVAPSAFYDNNKLSAASKGISRKRAMSSPMTGRFTAEGETMMTNEIDNHVMHNKSTHQGRNPPRAQLHVDDQSPYAEISELMTDSEESQPAGKTEPNGGAFPTVPEPPFPRSYLRSDNAYAITKVVAPHAKPRPSSHAD